MSAPEYRRVIERLRELAVQAEGALRHIDVDRFDERLPEGLDPEIQERLAWQQARVEVKAPRLRARLHPPTGSKQIRAIEIELRVVRTMRREVIFNDDARYDVHGLAAEDGELLARVIEQPGNLQRTAAGERTGLMSLRHVGSDSSIRGGTERAQLVETIHRFRGLLCLDTRIFTYLVTSGGDFLVTSDGDRLVATEAA